MKIVSRRIITLRGERDWVEATLSKSLSEGDHDVCGVVGSVATKTIEGPIVPTGERSYKQHFTNVDCEHWYGVKAVCEGIDGIIEPVEDKALRGNAEFLFAWCPWCGRRLENA